MSPIQESVLRAVGTGPRVARLVVAEVAKKERVEPDAAWAALCVLAAQSNIALDDNGGGVLLVRPSSRRSPWNG